MPSVSEVIDLCKNAGLEVRQNPARGGHTLWDIVDPATGTILTGISSHADRQGGDQNWHYNIRRMLRRAGFEINFIARPSKKNYKLTNRVKGAIDLEALAKAQAKAEAAGEHIPTLDDLEENPNYLKILRNGPNPSQVRGYTDEASDLVMEAMVPKAESSKAHYIVQRLIKVFDKYGPELEQLARERFEAEGKRYTIPAGKGARSEFVRIAMEVVAPTRNIRAWKSEASGQQTLHALLNKENAGLQLWTGALLEATMDHIEGLKWNEIDETRKRVVSPTKPEPTKPEPTKHADVEATLGILEEIEARLSKMETSINKLEVSVDYLESGSATDGKVLTESVMSGYSQVLLDLLAGYDESKGETMLKMIFERLDKMAGIS